ncbi:hypothetical protein BCD49_22265 [Pseudofrankia sp. EUN1h]|nr:hypothetical protein BCD49_22265 [Pseudofrankia sp. EUN1h]
MPSKAIQPPSVSVKAAQAGPCWRTQNGSSTPSTGTETAVQSSASRLPDSQPASSSWYRHHSCRSGESAGKSGATACSMLCCAQPIASSATVGV